LRPQVQILDPQPALFVGQATCRSGTPDSALARRRRVICPIMIGVVQSRFELTP
jgi:hypothetical protein